ncbi:serine/threonine-protein kinase [Actinophytocola sp.]|uniref:serine/threonine-protein kinase n=1 Tax=Actinophytocola sp. TaxID=1872138 RepID=UPI002ED1BE64
MAGAMWGAGRVVAGRYRLRSAVGAGAMGVVWQADDLRLAREVALKQLRLPPGLPDDDATRARQRVFKEARIAARLQHANAVAVFDVTSDDIGHPVLVMEYLAAESLDSAIAEYGTLSPTRVARIGAAIASALAAAHAAGIVHRDVKPGNVLLTPEGGAKITDFGLSQYSGDVTGDGLVAGTPAFLSPEAAWGEPPTPASDVFSLGATLYAAVEGEPPFGRAGNPVAQLERVAEGKAPPPRHAGPLTGVLTEMLRDDPAARPTMSEVAETLEDVVTDHPFDDSDTQPVPITDVESDPTLDDMDPVVPRTPAARWRRLTFAAVGLLAVGLLTLLVASRQPEDNRPNAFSPPPATSSADSPTAPPSTTPPTTTSTTTESSSSSEPPPAPDAEAFQRVVTDFYTLLPEDVDSAWALLGPNLQGQNRPEFEAYWAGVKDLRITGAPRVDGSTVVVQIEYTQEGRGKVSETLQHEITVSDDGTPLINSDQVVSSESPGNGRGNNQPGRN